MGEKLKTCFRSAVLFLILLFPNLYAIFMASDLSQPAKAAAYMVVVLAGLVLPMLLFRRRTYFIVMGVLYLFFAPIEVACLYLNHNPASTTFVGLIYAANWQEVVGIMSTVWPIAVVVVAIWVLYFVLAAKQPNEWMIPRGIGLCSLSIVLPLLFVGGLLFFSHYARSIYHIQSTREVLSLAKDLTLMKFNKIYPYNMYLHTGRVISDRRAMQKAQEALTPFRFGVQAPQDKNPELYVLVIGESARSDNFALNGYSRPTTPRLNNRERLVSYPHIYSQAGTTEVAVPHMLSRISAQHNEEVYTEKTLPEAFREAGYQTAWLTNKSRALYLQRVLEAMDRHFETGKDLSTGNNYDGYLLEPLQEELNINATKRLVVIHTMGSHWRYDTRYPASFEHFTPGLDADFQLTMLQPESRDRLVNAYDNTILYTDWFLDSLITMVEQTHLPAMVVYMSDHGENLYDDDRHLVLHGNYCASEWLFHVPFIVWYSREYEASHPDKIRQLRAHANTRDNSSILFHSLIDAAGLSYTNDAASSAVMRTRSIFSNNYQAPDTLFVLTTEGDCVALEY